MAWTQQGALSGQLWGLWRVKEQQLLSALGQKSPAAEPSAQISQETVGQAFVWTLRLTNDPDSEEPLTFLTSCTGAW